jgi:hypothetical protein
VLLGDEVPAGNGVDADVAGPLAPDGDRVGELCLGGKPCNKSTGSPLPAVAAR